MKREYRQDTDTWLAGKTVKNDGKALKQLLEDHFCICNFRHSGDYVFRAELSNGNTLVVITEPASEAEEEITIFTIYREGAET